MKHSLIGDRSFYRRAFAIALPIIIQNGITNLVSLLDNIMVGQLDPTQMSGVSVVNQFIFIFNLCIFGANSGPGIFTAQFYGSRDHNGIRSCFRYKLILCSLISLLGLGAFTLWGDNLIATFLQGEGTAQQIADTKLYGRQYLEVCLWGLPPFAIANAYAGSLRECGQTKVPMISGVIAVFVNLFFNWLLIFGNWGLPQMGVRGAALATVISRYVELAIVMVWAHSHTQEHPFIRGAYRSFSIPAPLLRKVILRGSPLLINELLWSMGITTLNQCYSTCGFDVVAASNIASTVSNLASVVTMALGNTIGILMGQMLGARAPEPEVRDTHRKLTALAVFMGFVFGGILAGISGLFPRFYNVTPSIRLLSAQLILVIAAMKPFHTFMYSGYFTLRSGGKTWVTFLYDGGFLWLCTVPLAFCLTRFTSIPILPVYILCQTPDLGKCIFGHILIKKGDWIQNIT